MPELATRLVSICSLQCAQIDVSFPTNLCLLLILCILTLTTKDALIKIHWINSDQQMQSLSDTAPPLQVQQHSSFPFAGTPSQFDHSPFCVWFFLRTHLQSQSKFHSKVSLYLCLFLYAPLAHVVRPSQFKIRFKLQDWLWLSVVPSEFLPTCNLAFNGILPCCWT